MKKLNFPVAGVALLISVVPGCATQPPVSEPVDSISGDQQVHCLLPARVRNLGGVVYPERRRMVYEQASICTVRGGEYTVYDRANAEGSIAFYQRVLEQDPDNAEAAFSLGLVYEALFSAPQYEQAALWYGKAADAGHTSAQKNLSYLYERGLGVEQDKLKALNLLREAGGISDDLVLQSDLEIARSEAAAEIDRLTAALESQNAETTTLRSELVAARKQVEARRSELAASRAEQGTLEQQLTALKARSQTESDPELLARIQTLETEAETNQRRLRQQDLTIQTLEADVVAQAAKLSASEQKALLQAEALNDRLEEVESSNAQVAERDARIAELEQELQALTASLSTEQQQRQQLSQALSVSEQSVATGEQAALEVSRLTNALASSQQAVDDQSQRIGQLQTRVAELDASTAEAQRLAGEVAELETALQAQRAQSETLQRELETQRAQAAAGEVASQDVVALRRELNAQDTTIAEQSDKIAQLSNVIQTLQENYVSQSDQQKAALVKLESELVNSRSELARLENQLRSQQASRAALQTENRRLNTELQRADQSEALSQLRQELSASTQELAQKTDEIDSLRDQIGEVQGELNRLKTDRGNLLADAGSLRTRSLRVPRSVNIKLPPGNKHALVIGNDRYENFPDLTTAVAGAEAMADVLRNQYGFQTMVLTNASERAMQNAFYDFSQKLGPDDYALIYYAGHGEIGDDKRSYWLPVDVGRRKEMLDEQAINNEYVASQVRAMKAKHVMIIADSCYAGTMVRSQQVGFSPEFDLDDLARMARSRSRTVLTSGGAEPVLDEGAGNHSVFTQALLGVLRQNEGVIYGQALHAELLKEVRFNASQLNFTQTPMYSEILDGGHHNGTFFFDAAG